MCFSATASFVSSAALVTAGTLTVARSKKTSFRYLGLVPILFSLQQFSEGFVWLALENEQFIRYLDIASFGFVFFAWIIWPFYIPLSIYKLEENIQRLKAMRVLLAIGVILSGLLAYALIFIGVDPQISAHSISYKFPVDKSVVNIMSIIYLCCTIVPELISTTKRVWILGVSTLILFITAQILFSHALLSVWCMFCAISSLLILYVIPASTRPKAITKIVV